MCCNTLSHTHTSSSTAHVVICVQVTAVTSELSDERFRSDAVGQTLDVEKAERLRLSRENKELRVGPLVEKVICKLRRLQELFEK